MSAGSELFPIIFMHTTFRISRFKEVLINEVILALGMLSEAVWLGTSRTSKDQKTLCNTMLDAVITGLPIGAGTGPVVYLQKHGDLQ
ncbi:hypothetical protein HOO54_10310 [Bacillus sp. WMMC1349]|uniref:hypothetical protein n=1 Tax=Bacillus sp. WMMC1349 TaxID=2736254 RepID=UPI001553852F|nr:hypothetical protein [Bacillus sp. WMMC1349]NPC92611.1 hypothetical protein [Bacillus sp. WMMC1349]